MFLLLWNYLNGYVIIKVKGFSVERFINMASYRGIYIWDMNTYEGFVYLKVSLKGLNLLKECAIKTGCCFEIIEKKGFPFLWIKYKNRKILIFGILIFIIFIYILSSFVWEINIYGNERVAEQQILDIIKNRGVTPGKLKFGIDTEQLSRDIIENIRDISWTSISIKGTDLIINIAETIEKPDTRSDTYCDIISEKDGIVLSVIVSSGIPVVKANDVVHKGDLLVSGEILLKDDGYEFGREYISSEAQVLAKIWYEFYNEVPFNYKEKVYTGEFKKDTYLKFNDVILNIITPAINYEEYDIKTNIVKNFSFGDFVLPISFQQDIYKEYDFVEKKLTIDEAKNIMNYKIEEDIIETIEDGDVIECDIEYIEKDNILYSKATLSVIERIDVKYNYN